MPYVTCSACGIRTYLVSQGECAGCGRVLRAAARQGPLTGGDPERSIHRTLELARSELGVDTALISEVAGGRETVRWAVGNGAIAGFAAGASLPLEDTICRHLLEGRIASLVPDVEQDPVLCSLPLPRMMGVRAYLGVPITADDAHRYVLCCLALEARHDLGDADVRFLQGLTESLALSDALRG